MVQPRGYINAAEEASFSFPDDEISSSASKRWDEELRGISFVTCSLRVGHLRGIAVYLFVFAKLFVIDWLAMGNFVSGETVIS